MPLSPESHPPQRFHCFARRLCPLIRFFPFSTALADSRSTTANASTIKPRSQVSAGSFVSRPLQMNRCGIGGTGNGGGPPPHSHDWDESFYVLRGEVEIVCDGNTAVLGAGSLVHVPRGTVHGYGVRIAA